MSGRDHSAPCDECGEERGGLNDTPCACDDPELYRAAAREIRVALTVKEIAALPRDTDVQSETAIDLMLAVARDADAPADERLDACMWLLDRGWGAA